MGSGWSKMTCAGPRGYYLLDGIGLCSEVYEYQNCIYVNNEGPLLGMNW